MKPLMPGLLVSLALTVPANVCAQNVVKTIIRSEMLQQDRAFAVHLPAQFDSTKQYPVLYVLDGLSQSQHLADKFDSLSAAGLVAQTIVVGIPNMTAENRQRQLIPPYMKIDHEKPESPTGEGDTFLSYMESELFPFIEKTYPASKVRLFAGNSRGGLLVMHSLLYNPEMFQARFCFSTPFWREDNLIVTKVSEFLRSLDSLQTFLYMSAGEQETDNIKNGLAAMASTLKAQGPNKLGWYAEYTPNANHQTNAQQSAASGIMKWGEYIRK
ncbi:MAG: alpha/beta hydrolase [Bacteroidota bacterium]